MNSDKIKINYLTEIRKRIAAFPAMPALSCQLLTELNNPNLDFSSFAEKIKYDPGMTANVLKLANSAYFGCPGQIDSLQTAFVRLGVKKLFQMGVTIGVSGILNRPLKGYDLGARDLLRHSVWTAIAAEELAGLLKIQTLPLLFTAGILHDLGKIVLDTFIDSEWTQIEQIICESNKADRPFEVIEHSILGMDHAETGAELLDKWNFPKELVAAARWHHKPEKAGTHQNLVSIIHIADTLAYSEGIGTGHDGLRYQVSENATIRLGLSRDMIERASSRTLIKMQELEGQL